MSSELLACIERLNKSLKGFISEASDDLLKLIVETPVETLQEHLGKEEEMVGRVVAGVQQELDRRVTLASLDAAYHSGKSGQSVTPWGMEAEDNKGIDFDKLINQFGSDRIDDKLLRRIEEVTNQPLHPWLKRGYFFSHRDLEKLLDSYTEGNPFYLYTGRGPSSDALHFGHMIPFMFTSYLQRVFDVPLVVQMTDDEKYLWRPQKVPTPQSAFKMTRENARDIIAVGFDVSKTFIFSNFTYVGQMYPNICRVQRNATVNMAKSIFGFTDSYNLGQMAFPGIQAAPSFSSSFPHMFDPAGPARQCLIPCAIDQDPYFRMTRTIAPKLDLLRPALIHSKFFPALQGAKTKMSASDQNSAIFMSDTAEQVEHKVKHFAFSGGRETTEEHRRLGADLDVDVSIQYLDFFMEDEERLAQIRKDYGSGRMLTGEVKDILVETLVEVLHTHQASRAAVTDDVIDTYMSVRDMRGSCN